MSTAEDRQQRRDLRGRILRTCRRVFGSTPNTLTLESIWRGVGRHEWLQFAVQEEVRYLLDLGYLQSPDNKRDALDEDAPIVFRLTAKGMQVLNGDLEDASIEA